MGKRKDRPNFMYRKTLVQGPHGYVCPIEDIHPGDMVLAVRNRDLFNLKPMYVTAVHDAGMLPCLRTAFEGYRFFTPGQSACPEKWGAYKPDKKNDIYGDGQWHKSVKWLPVLDSSPDLEILCCTYYSIMQNCAMPVNDHFYLARAVCNVYDQQMSFKPTLKVRLRGLRHLYGLELEDRSAFFLLQNGLVAGSV